MEFNIYWINFINCICNFLTHYLITWNSGAIIFLAFPWIQWKIIIHWQNKELFESKLDKLNLNYIHRRNFMQWQCVRYCIYLFIATNNWDNSKKYIFRYDMIKWSTIKCMLAYYYVKQSNERMGIWIQYYISKLNKFVLNLEE